MKTSKFFTTIMAVLFLTSFGTANNEQTSVQGAVSEKIIVVSQPELNHLATIWASGFEKSSTAKLTVVPQIPDGKQLSENTFYLVDENSPLIQKETNWKMVAAHDVVVAIMNSGNKELGLLNKQGITSEGFSMALKGNGTWNQLVKGAAGNKVKCYISDTQDVIGKIAEFTGITNQDLYKESFLPVADVMDHVRKDVNAIGFCKLSDIVKPGENTFIPGIVPIPVDKNKNGILDQFENICQNPAAFSRGVWVGKYPRELTGDIFLVAAEKPTGKANLEFLSYVLNNGQTQFKDAGFAVLTGKEKTIARATFSNLAKTQPTPELKLGISRSLLIGGILVLALIAMVVYLFAKRRIMSEIIGEDLEIAPFLSEKMIQSPKGLYYGKSHTWAFMEPDGLVNVGVDDFIKRITGAITQIKFREPGERIRKGEKLFTLVHEGKQLDFYSPVTGFIREKNQILLKSPAKLNTAPFADGWIYKIEPANWLKDTSFMFMVEKYREWLDDEFIRLKDFLANTANNNQLVYQHIVLQDGGELKDEVLAEMGPEIWEEFQTRFIDVSK
jgi:glycine cleavage system H lipoate-binding protein